MQAESLKKNPPWKEEKEFLGVLARTFWKLFACKFWDLTTLSGQILNLLEGINTYIYFVMLWLIEMMK